MKDITGKVYDALADIMFLTGAKKEDMKEALNFFMDRFFYNPGDDDGEEETE